MDSLDSAFLGFRDSVAKLGAEKTEFETLRAQFESASADKLRAYRIAYLAQLDNVNDQIVSCHKAKISILQYFATFLEKNLKDDKELKSIEEINARLVNVYKFEIIGTDIIIKIADRTKIDDTLNTTQNIQKIIYNVTEIESGILGREASLTEEIDDIFTKMCNNVNFPLTERADTKVREIFQTKWLEVQGKVNPSNTTQTKDSKLLEVREKVIPSNTTQTKGWSALKNARKLLLATGALATGIEALRPGTFANPNPNPNPNPVSEMGLSQTTFSKDLRTNSTNSTNSTKSANSANSAYPAYLATPALPDLPHSSAHSSAHFPAHSPDPSPDPSHPLSQPNPNST